MSSLFNGCPKCGSKNIHVVYTKERRRKFRVRRKWCKACDHRFYTVQPPEHVVAYAHEPLHPLFIHAERCESWSTQKPSSSAA
ncbi:MAG: hypothetical protein ACO28M_03510 [Vulcanococcus sp.]|jgi:hypothetical protein